MPERITAAVRVRRILSLLPHLCEGSEIPLDTLAAHLGATPEQLAEDIELLSMCGAWPYSPDMLVSAFVEDGVVRCYQAPPALDQRMQLTGAEAQALATALRIAGATEDDALLTLLSEVSGRPPGVERTVDAFGIGSRFEVYARLSAASATARKARIRYWTPGRDRSVDRTVRPLSLTNDRGVWYLRAHCESTDEERTFRLDRIREAEILDDSFERPPAPGAAALFPAEGSPVADISFAPGCEFSERDWPGSTFERVDDGSVLARVPYASEAWVARRVAARLGEAEVLSPPSLRSSVAELASSGSAGA